MIRSFPWPLTAISLLLLAAAVAACAPAGDGAADTATAEPTAGLTTTDHALAADPAQVAGPWVLRFRDVGVDDVAARVALYREFLDSVDEAGSLELIGATGSHLFDRRTVRFLLARALNRLGDYPAASAEYDRLLADDPGAIPHRRVATSKAINDLEQPVDQGIMVPAVHREALRLALAEIEETTPQDAYDQRLNYHIGVLAHLDGLHEEVIERFSAIAVRVSEEGVPALADPTELEVTATALDFLAQAAGKVGHAPVAEGVLRLHDAVRARIPVNGAVTR